MKALVEGGADINQLNAGDKTSPLLITIINGHFDLAMYLLDKGADPNGAAFNGVAPLYAVLNIQWAPKSLYPSPKAYQQQTTTYLQLMTALLGKGADPNARVGRKVWYQAYNSDYAGVRRSRRDAVFPRRLRERRGRDEAARLARRRREHPDLQARGPAVYR